MLDIIILLIFAAFIFYGWRKGLVITVYNLLSFVAAILLSRIIYPVVARALRSGGIFLSLRDRVFEGMEWRINDALEAAGGVIGELFFKALKLPSFITSALDKNYNAPAADRVTPFTDISTYICGFIANFIISVFAMLITIAVIFIAIKIVGSILKIITRLPVIKTFDKLGGIAAGAVFGVITAWLFLTVYSMLEFQTNTFFGDALRNSVLAPILQNSNLIYKALVSIIR